MINAKELAICEKRGHNVRMLDDMWAQCKWCGTWVREVRTIEEREDDPAPSEVSVFSKLDDRAAEQPQEKKKKKKKKK